MASRMGLSADVPARRTNALSELTRRVLWARAAGRCEYEGCNKSLLDDLLSGTEDRNFGFVAHIIADTPTGPRGDALRSAKLSDDISNVMLLCHVHHKLIDVDAVAAHPEARLLGMKAAHERRIAIVTAVGHDRASHVLRYAANIGGHQSPIHYEQLSVAMLPSRYPADGHRTIDIAVLGTDQKDHEPEFWLRERENLQRQFGRKIQERVEQREVRHLSVFALAPQPLLIELGRLLGDIVPADVYQLHREPGGWAWPEGGASIAFRTRHSASSTGAVALVVALSATVTDDRIREALGSDAAIWAIEAVEPHNDLLKRQEDLREFRRLVRGMLDQIKAARGEQETIHLFPVVPVAVAVEIGRVWMPKADLPLVVYDQNRRAGGFVRALEIESSGASFN